MSDTIDDAQARDREFLDFALRNHQHRLATHAGARMAGQAALDARQRDCEDCDQPIPDTRLAVVPQATRCTFCQTQFELAGGEQQA